ncbi:hypothetical protein [Sorangium sp. So ce233]|uniref:hypothetical protein n=1 Tax=Sorangium sp. So ce233 TaxID=3133290 RepID=UPI003F5E549B
MLQEFFLGGQQVGQASAAGAIRDISAPIQRFTQLLKDDCSRYVAHAHLDQVPAATPAPFSRLLLPSCPAYGQMNSGEVDVASTGDVDTEPAPITTDYLLIWLNLHVTGTDVNFSTLLSHDAP